MHKIGIHEFPTKEEAYRWLFADKDGKPVSFSNKEIGIRIFKWGKDFYGTVEIGYAKANIKLVHDESSKRVLVYFPHKELGEVVPFDQSVAVGRVWMDRDGNFWFGAI